MAVARSVDPHYSTVITGEQDGTEYSIVADSSWDGVGGGTGMSPTTLLDSALAGCISMTIQIAADVRGIALEAVMVEVTHDAEADHTDFHVDIQLTGDLTDREREGLLRTLRGCPVSKILSKPITIALSDA